MKLLQPASRVNGAAPADLDPGEKLFYERCATCRANRAATRKTSRLRITRSAFSRSEPGTVTNRTGEITLEGIKYTIQINRL